MFFLDAARHCTKVDVSTICCSVIQPIMLQQSYVKIYKTYIVKIVFPMNLNILKQISMLNL